MAPRPVSNPRKSARNYAANPKSKARKDAYNKVFNRKPSQLKKRAELARVRRERGIMGKGGPDMSHTKDGRIVAESARVNRARNRGKK